MRTVDVVIVVAFFAVVIAVSWVMPRRFGVLGMIAGQLMVVFAFFVLTAISIGMGTYEYEGADSIIGLVVMAFWLNCALLPVGLAALWRRGRCAARASLN